MASNGQVPDEFPNYKDADVLILSLTGNTWKLHSRILSNCSPVFKGIFSKQAPAKIRREDRENGNLLQWKLQMVRHPAAIAADPNGTHYMDFMAVDLHKKQPMPFGMLAGTGNKPSFNAIYDNLFRVFYNLEPDFTPIDVVDVEEQAAPMCEALNLLTAAGYLKAYPSVRAIIESFLLSFNQLLWYEIEHRPEVWASLACKLRSASMFREAMLHLAGRYHLRGADSVKQNVLANIEWGAAIMELTKQKGRELKDYKLQAERHLFEFVPERMIHEAKAQVGGVVAPGRAVYANDIYWWMALNLIRQYFSSAVLQNQHHRAPDGGIAFYRTIACPHSYLLHDSFEAFQKMFSMTPKSRVVFINALSELKKEVAPIVSGLLVNHSQAQKPADAPPYRYLTCTVVLDEELPWIEKPVEDPSIDTPIEGTPDRPVEADAGSSGGSNPLFIRETQNNNRAQNASDGSNSREPTSNDQLENGASVLDEDLPDNDWGARATRASPRQKTWASARSPAHGSVGRADHKDNNASQDEVATPTTSAVSTILRSLRRPAQDFEQDSATPLGKRRKGANSQATVSKDLPTIDSAHSQTASTVKQSLGPAGHRPVASRTTNTKFQSGRVNNSSTIDPTKAMRAKLNLNSKTAHILSGALALNLLPEDQKLEIHARAAEAHAQGVPHMQGLLSNPPGKIIHREGLNMKFRSFVEAETLGYGSTAEASGGGATSGNVESLEDMVAPVDMMMLGRDSSTSQVTQGRDDTTTAITDREDEFDQMI